MSALYPSVNQYPISDVMLDLGISNFFLCKRGKNGAVAITEDKVFKTSAGYAKDASVTKEFMLEQWVLHAVTNSDAITSVNTPGLIKLINGDTLVQTRVPGKPLSSFVENNFPGSAFFSEIGTVLADFSVEFDSALRKHKETIPYDVPRLSIEPHRLAWKFMPSQEESGIMDRAVKRLATSDLMPMTNFCIHADLHCNNVLYDKATNRVGIIDFGLVKISPIEDMVWRFIANFGNDGLIAARSFADRICEKTQYRIDRDIVTVCLSNSVYFALCVNTENEQKVPKGRRTFIDMYNSLAPRRPETGFSSTRAQCHKDSMSLV